MADAQFTNRELALAADFRWLPVLERTSPVRASQIAGATKPTARKFLREAASLGLVTREEVVIRGGIADEWTPTARAHALANHTREGSSVALPARRGGFAIIAILDELPNIEATGDDPSEDLYVELRKFARAATTGSTVYRLTLSD
jgi:hypothetical protein